MTGASIGSAKHFDRVAILVEMVAPGNQKFTTRMANTGYRSRAFAVFKKGVRDGGSSAPQIEIFLRTKLGERPRRDYSGS